MDKYLAKPTKIIGENGAVKTIDQVSCNGEHSGGESSGECKFTDERNKALQQASQKAELALNLADEMYNQWDIGGRIDDAKKIANEAKNTANIAHNTAISILEELDVVEKAAEIAEERAIEAYNSLHSLNGDYEALKARVEDLEETDGQASEPIVGKSKMGYVPDFTEFGLSNKHEVYVELGDEGRSLTFDSNTVLGDVVEELMYCTATGITNHHNRLTALENGSGGSASGGSTTHGNCLENEVSIRQFYLVDDDDFIADGVPEEEIPALKDDVLKMTAAEGIETAYALAKAVKTKVKINVLPRLEALESGSGGSSSGGVSVDDVLQSQITFKPGSGISYDALKAMGVPEDQYETFRNQEQTITVRQAVVESTQGTAAVMSENNYVIKPKLQDHETRITQNSNTIAGHTSSIQSLDTRTGSHTASIGQLENRMTDVEVQTTTNKTDIASLNTLVGSKSNTANGTVIYRQKRLITLLRYLNQSLKFVVEGLASETSISEATKTEIAKSSTYITSIANETEQMLTDWGYA